MMAYCSVRSRGAPDVVETEGARDARSSLITPSRSKKTAGLNSDFFIYGQV